MVVTRNIIDKNRKALIKLFSKFVDVHAAIGDIKTMNLYVYLRRVLLVADSAKYDRLADNVVVEEFCRIGSSAILQKLLGDKNVRSYIDLGGVMGVGPATVARLHEVGVYTVADLKSMESARESIEYELSSPGDTRIDADTTRAMRYELASTVKLNAVQKLGVRYYDDLRQRIPRQEVESLYVQIKSVMTSDGGGGGDIDTIVLGSYRRGAPTSGDIDILICGGSGDVVGKIRKKIIAASTSNSTAGPLIAIIAQGLQKMSFLWRSNISGLVRHIDLFYATRRQYIPYLLYGTGSAEHNEMMRAMAKMKGYKLNQTGLWRADGSQKILRQEEDLYCLLGIEYIPPTRR